MFLAAFTSAWQAKPQAVHPKTRLTLTRLRVHVPTRRAPLAGERRADLLHPARSLIRQPPHQHAPARGQDPPVEPSFGPDVPARIRGRPPGRAGHARYLQILDPDQVEPAREVRGYLLGPVLAPVRLAGLQPRKRRLTRPRRPEPRSARASLRSSRRRRSSAPARSGPVRAAVHRSTGPQLTATPRSMPTASPLPGAGTGAGIAAKATCQRPARSIVTRHDVTPGVRHGTSGTGSSRPSVPRLHRVLRDRRRTCPWPARRTTRNPSSRPALRHDGRPAGFAGSKNAAIAPAKSRSACC